jgi:hypothetical protein
MEEPLSPFEFKQCVNILKSTGKKARSLRELRETISLISTGALFYHTCQYYLKGHILQYTNDFAHWAGEVLEESVLAEQLSNIDPYAYVSIDAIRSELIRVIDEYLKAYKEPREVRPGEEFFFEETVTLVFSAGIQVRNLAEFLIAVRYLDASSIYYHFYEARVRLGGRDDFSNWLEHSLNKATLAEKIRKIDLFMHTIEGTRSHIIESIEEEVQRDMEGMTR